MRARLVAAKTVGRVGDAGRAALVDQKAQGILQVDLVCIDLAALEARVVSGEIDPTPVSGRQEQLENLVNRTIWATS